MTALSPLVVKDTLLCIFPLWNILIYISVFMMYCCILYFSYGGVRQTHNVVSSFYDTECVYIHILVFCICFGWGDFLSIISHWYVRYCVYSRLCTISVCLGVYKCTCFCTPVLQCVMNSSVSPNVTTLVRCKWILEHCSVQAIFFLISQALHTLM